MKLGSLRELYTDQLKDLFSAELQVRESLRQLVRGASAPELQEAFKRHLEETEKHVVRLSKIFEDLGTEPTGKTCEAMKGLIKEGADMLGKKMGTPPAVLDAGLIAAAQRIEHYEIAAYGTACTFAALLGEDRAAGLLQETLDEEGQADKILMEVAEKVNLEAEAPYEEGASAKQVKRSTAGPWGRSK